MEMIKFDQWLGFLLIMCILTAGFWIFFFLLSFLPYWIMGYWKNRFKVNKERKEEEQKALNS